MFLKLFDRKCAKMFSRKRGGGGQKVPKTNLFILGSSLGYPEALGRQKQPPGAEILARANAIQVLE